MLTGVDVRPNALELAAAPFLRCGAVRGVAELVSAGVPDPESGLWLSLALLAAPMT